MRIKKLLITWLLPLSGCILSCIGLLLKKNIFFIFLIPVFLLIILMHLLSSKKPDSPDIKKKNNEQETHDFREIKNKIKNITGFLKSMLRHNRIDLTRQIKTSDSILVTLEDYINFLILSVGEMIEWIVEQSEKLCLYSAEINHFTTISKKKSEEQVKYSFDIIDTVQGLVNSFQKIMDMGSEAYKIVDKANNIYEDGYRVMDDTVFTIKDLVRTIHNNTTHIRDLNQFTKELDDVVKLIMNMAKKTNLLSLNASIEAVRAGEAGKGFKVVAREIQNFSAATTEASKKISENVNKLNNKIKKSFQVFQKSHIIADSAILKTSEVKRQFIRISENIASVFESIQNINDIIRTNLNEVSKIDEKITSIQETVSDFKHEFHYLSESAKNITGSSEEIVFAVNHFQIHNYQTFVYGKMEEAAQKIIKIMETKVREGLLEHNQLFDTNYQHIPDTNPKKYRTIYDQIIEKDIQVELENLKYILSEEAPNYNKKFVACAITDINGYAPAHLKQQSQILTGDYEYDVKNSRHKRIFNDPISLKAARNKEEHLFQAYLRDIGHQFIDISIPIRVFDTHWGCLRAGYMFLDSE